LEHAERIAILVTIIVMLTKIVNICIILVTMKRIQAATYELFGGIAPDFDPLEAMENFPRGREDNDGAPE